MNTIRVYKANGCDVCPDEYVCTIAGQRITFYSLLHIRQYLDKYWPQLTFELDIV